MSEMSKRVVRVSEDRLVVVGPELEVLERYVNNKHWTRGTTSKIIARSIWREMEKLT